MESEKVGGQMDGAGVVVLVVFILIIVAVIAYRVGYMWSQVEFLDPSHRLHAKWRMLPMEAPLPRWRRVAGWVAYVFSALLLCLFLALAYLVRIPLGVGLFDGGMDSVVRHLPGSALARRVVLEARPRGPGRCE